MALKRANRKPHEILRLRTTSARIGNVRKRRRESLNCPTKVNFSEEFDSLINCQLLIDDPIEDMLI